MDEFLGTIKMFGFNFTPRGFAPCNGQLLPISSNSALFSLLGTTYGGNGTTTFALPDLRGRVPVGMGQGAGLSNYMIGQTGGTETVTLTTAQIPAHTHAATGLSGKINASDANANQSNAAGHVLATANDAGGRESLPIHVYSDGTPNTALNNASVEVTGNVANTGGSQAHENKMPYLALNFCICTEGIYPSRE